MKPTIYITNWSSRKLHGPGHKYTIMANPRHWEFGNGRVSRLVPDLRDLEAVKAGKIEESVYFSRYEDKVRFLEKKGHLNPGALFSLQSGSTLCCACSREAASQRRCHRVFAAEALARSGWRVILDGQELKAHHHRRTDT